MSHPNNRVQEPTPSATLEPMGFAQFLDFIFSLYRSNFRLFAGICSVYFIYGAITITLFTLIVLSAGNSGASLEFGLIDIVVASLIGAVVMLFVMGALSFAAAKTIAKEPITVGGSFKQVIRRFWPYLKGNVLNILVVLLLAITIIGIPFALFLFIRWVFYTATALFEEKGAVEALKRSSELVKGGWWRVFGMLLAVVLLIVVVQIAVMLTFSFIIGLMRFVTEGWQLPSASSDATWREILLETFVSEATLWESLRVLFNLLVTSLILPLGVIGNTLLYFDRRIRKEGYDIETRVAEARG